jgi:hypothetical protein
MRRILEKLGIMGRSSGELSNAKTREAVEHLVESTEPRIRLVPGYRKKLQPLVAAALSHIDTLVEQIPGPLDMSRAAFVNDPYVKAYFVSPDDLQQIFNDSGELKEFFDDLNHGETEGAYALLCANRNEKTVLGVTLNGNDVRRDVLQTMISFHGHKILSPAVSEKEVRRGIKQCIFDGLITYALRHILDLKYLRRDLEDNRRILQSRLRARRASGGGLSALLAGDEGQDADRDDIEDQLSRTEETLKKMPESQDLLSFYLQEIMEILASPEDFIQLNVACFRLTDMGVKVGTDVQETANTVCFSELEVTHVLKRVVTVVRYPREGMLSC